MSRHGQDLNHQTISAKRSTAAQTIIDQWASLTLLQKWQAAGYSAEVDAYVLHTMGAQNRSLFEGGEGPYGPGSDSDTSNFPAEPLDPVIAKILGLDQSHQNSDPAEQKKHGAHGPKQG